MSTHEVRTTIRQDGKVVGHQSASLDVGTVERPGGTKSVVSITVEFDPPLIVAEEVVAP